MDDFKKELEKDLGPIENSIRHCRRLLDDYQAEQKEAFERRESEDEGARRGRPQGSQLGFDSDYNTGNRKKTAQSRVSVPHATGAGAAKAVTMAAPEAQANAKALQAQADHSETGPQGYASRPMSREHDQGIQQLEMKAKIAAADYQQRQLSIKKNANKHITPTVGKQTAH